MLFTNLFHPYQSDLMEWHLIRLLQLIPQPTITHNIYKQKPPLQPPPLRTTLSNIVFIVMMPAQADSSWPQAVRAKKPLNRPDPK
ncbi:hypothetical protein CEXT_577221 [Caerostris extrusa]|uniref:Uncharacterized protein n=1 Tax=Caerostris extrusa TaxID=172846 RepID=A0AAV4N9G9_CAEEX|nr:hypothetical protein CEXT_577221 [Caerostris extrusa]